MAGHLNRSGSVANGVGKSIWAIISVDMLAVIIDHNDKTVYEYGKWKPQTNPETLTNCFRFWGHLCVPVSANWILDSGSGSGSG